MRSRRSALALLTAAALATTACGELGDGPGRLSQRIGELVQDQAVSELDLGRLTDFGWDRFVLFKASTPREEVCEFIGIRPAQCGRVVRYAAVPDNFVAIAFALDNSLTHLELHALANGHFEIDAPLKGLSRTAAVFRIRRETSATGPGRAWLEPKQLPTPTPSAEPA